MSAEIIPVRRIRDEDLDRDIPIYAVWELTLKCDHACSHCGSRAGASRPYELNFEEIKEVARSLMRLGTREVTIIGGEAYLRDDVYDIIRFLAEGGIRVTMQTGGRSFDSEMAAKMKDAGLAAVGFSVDGLKETHDLLRNAPGSFDSVMRAIEAAKEMRLPVTANTQVNRVNKDSLRALGARLKDSGVRVWRAQLTVPMGRAADEPDWILEPYQILEVMDVLAEIQLDAAREARQKGIPIRRAFGVQASNNLGYYGPHEQILRSRPGQPESYWKGCQAGKYTLGIESDGTVKGCPSLPTAPYAGGNVRNLSLERIWKQADTLAFTRDRTKDELWGFCKSCYYADVCMAGCSFTTHSTFGRRGNNPFCYYRADTLKKQGLRETLRRVERADGLPYDFGKFEIVREPWGGEP
jgi:radical SAM protein with 4Fe4S-binding SPASM domain